MRGTDNHFKKLAGETWREAVKRIAREYGLEHECIKSFDSYVRSDPNPELAGANSAYCTLYDWDILGRMKRHSNG